jgi:hypothetical protein
VLTYSISSLLKVLLKYVLYKVNIKLKNMFVSKDYSKRREIQCSKDRNVQTTLIRYAEDIPTERNVLRRIASLLYNLLFVKQM